VLCITARYYDGAEKTCGDHPMETCPGGHLQKEIDNRRRSDYTHEKNDLPASSLLSGPSRRRKSRRD